MPCSDSASGIDAAPVLPWWSIVLERALGVEAEALGQRGGDPRVGLVGHDQRDVGEVDAGLLEHLAAARLHPRDRALEDELAVHADLALERVDAQRLGVAGIGAQDGPRSAARPPAFRTTAPAPSANSAAVLRSVWSVMRESVSAPITSAVCARPVSIRLLAVRTAAIEAGAGQADVPRHRAVAAQRAGDERRGVGHAPRRRCRWRRARGRSRRRRSRRRRARRVPASIASASRRWPSATRGRVCDAGAARDPLGLDAKAPGDVGGADDTDRQRVARGRRSRRRPAAGRRRTSDERLRRVHLRPPAASRARSRPRR